MTDGSEPHTRHQPWLQNFIVMYQALGTSKLDRQQAGSQPQDFKLLHQVYHSEVEFIDPLHHVSGICALVAYFKNIYTHVEHCQFAIHHVVESDHEAAIYWTMTYTHRKLNHHQPIKVEGHSHLKQREGMVGYHRDYLDVGAMVYEHIPLLGRVIKTIKQRAGE
ncbi:nuclear transport factor 2 family protein [Vibrio algicola]|uniref:DUF2358 domain-containing protein n=1 Tax=Vibrio algicola TaxID=2662262 RepID=A0A5Q0TBB4_9VIBR|nr:nuclear transport factor 2 family protein [Vibrio algicola]